MFCHLLTISHFDPILVMMVAKFLHRSALQKSQFSAFSCFCGCILILMRFDFVCSSLEFDSLRLLFEKSKSN